MGKTGNKNGSLDRTTQSSNNPSGNHDGEVHDKVEILASGRVLNGGDDDDNGNVGVVLKVEAIHYTFSHYVWGGSILVLGGFVGYVISFVSHGRRQVVPGRGRTSVKTQET
ncbi:hypothetical protein F3Y22_tig00111798pilonHSYRG00033 [Hibiscus syriacus]|uniref:Transmembrane protein n=1 Tax=Hibiscus syriacus TaxID=106335 RepID=A0A6A2YF25_HIBSY|nr:hypothetical protein F3Y22_tig00111798pilonHSYRG00033 [Hibiscus syriacus]